MLEKLRNNPRIVVVTLIAAGVLAIAVAAGNNNNQQQATPEAAPQSNQSNTDGQNADNGDEEQPAEENATPANDASGSSNPSSVVTQGTQNVEVRNEAGSFKTTVKTGNNQTVVVRKMVSDYLTSKSQTLSDEQKLYIETTIVSQLPRREKIYPGEEISVTEDLLAKTIEASKQLTDQQIKRWGAYL